MPIYLYHQFEYFPGISVNDITFNFESSLIAFYLQFLLEVFNTDGMFPHTKTATLISL